MLSAKLLLNNGLAASLPLGGPDRREKNIISLHIFQKKKKKKKSKYIFNGKSAMCNLSIYCSPSTSAFVRPFAKPFSSHLFGLVEAGLVTVGEVESCELLSQFLLRAGYRLQCCVQFNVTGTLWDHRERQTVRTTLTCKQTHYTLT